jgi:glutathionylspermidine synthase
MKTTNLEISKKLKEAGFEAETDFGYHKSGQFPLQKLLVSDTLSHIKAYDLETILDSFPKETEIRISNLTKERIFYLDSWWKNIRGNEASIAIEDNESLADTAGKMWLLLKERGLIC